MRAAAAGRWRGDSAAAWAATTGERSVSAHFSAAWRWNTQPCVSYTCVGGVGYAPYAGRWVRVGVTYLHVLACRESAIGFVSCLCWPRPTALAPPPYPLAWLHPHRVCNHKGRSTGSLSRAVKLAKCEYEWQGEGCNGAFKKAFCKLLSVGGAARRDRGHRDDHSEPLGVTIRWGGLGGC